MTHAKLGAEFQGAINVEDITATVEPIIGAVNVGDVMATVEGLVGPIGLGNVTAMVEPGLSRPLRYASLIM